MDGRTDATRVLVAYTRVSTQRQGQSGLGLEAQRDAIERHSRATGQPVIGWYTEIESGRKNDRPELAKALAHARRARAALVVAKLDRLARNVAFLANMLEAGVDFVAVDQPSANRLTLHVLAAVAEDEARRISERTRAALAAAKARGVVLGATIATNATPEGRAKGSATSGRLAKERADVELAEVIAIARDLRGQGMTQRMIADRLNEAGHATRAGKAWGQVAVKRLLGRGGAPA